MFEVYTAISENLKFFLKQIDLINVSDVPWIT
jgi:hypothetical protein